MPTNGNVPQYGGQDKVKRLGDGPRRATPVTDRLSPCVVNPSGHAGDDYGVAHAPAPVPPRTASGQSKQRW